LIETKKDLRAAVINDAIPMLIIGVTGGIACGKSLVGKYLAEEGVDVCEADTFAHEAFRQDGAADRYVLNAFGQEILNPDRTINRHRLGQRVFASEPERRRLNACVHPAVRDAWRQWLRERCDHLKAAVVIVPLLFETNLDVWDVVICVAAPESFQIEKMRQRGLTEPEARQRMAAQMPLPRKIQQSDYVILNAGSRSVLKRQLKRILNRILERAHG
jgi:dephospho-CoA kinase